MGILRTRCFLSMPMQEDFAELRSALATALEGAGFEVPLIEDQTSSRTVIKQCHFVIADLTTSNPNAIYEVGLAHGIGLPVLILTRSLESAPRALLQDNLFLVYNPKDLRQLLLRVLGWIGRSYPKADSR